VNKIVEIKAHVSLPFGKQSRGESSLEDQPARYKRCVMSEIGSRVR
jgi:hypothetical protein